MLLTMRAYIDAMRYLLYSNAQAIDIAEHDPDPAAREAARELVELLHPDLEGVVAPISASSSRRSPLQVHGGMGYVEETGVAQHYRDARISPIYEGTNGIQAIDLVGRKLPMRGGAVVAEHLARIDELADADRGGGRRARGDAAAPLADASAALRDATDWLLANGADRSDRRARRCVALPADVRPRDRRLAARGAALAAAEQAAARG